MSKYIVFTSSSGGVGKTTIAMNAVCHLGKTSKVLLVDMSLYGGLDVVLRQNNRSTGLGVLYGLFEKDNTFDIDRGIVRNEVLKCDVIVSAKPLVMDKIGSDFIQILINEIQRKNYDYVIFDTSSELSERNVRIAQLASDLICIMTQDISVSWRVMKYVEILERLQIERSKVRVVLNNFRKDVEFNIADFEEIVQLKVEGQIPYLKGIVTDIENSGKFIIKTKGKHYKRLFKHLWEV